MNRLTRQEQLVLCIVLFLLLVGMAVKTWRLRHPGPAPMPPGVSETVTNAGEGLE